MFRELLATRSKQSGSLLCIGLDPNPLQISAKFGRSSRQKIRDFCLHVIDETKDLVCAYKPQIAYFSAEGAESELTEIIEYIHSNARGVPVILDAKRSDIGSTAKLYAKELFARYEADAATINPYLGWDTIEPFLEFEGRGLFILSRTSNAGASWLQEIPSSNPIYKQIASKVDALANPNVGVVVGATAPDELHNLRDNYPNLLMLVPGVGSQDGNVERTLAAQQPGGGGLVINVSRGVLYASESEADLGVRTRALHYHSLLEFGKDINGA